MTFYDQLMKNMTIDQMATLTCKMVTVNGNQIFYMSSSGQLFPPSQIERAYEFEKRLLSQEIPQEEKASEDDGMIDDQNESATTEELLR